MSVTIVCHPWSFDGAISIAKFDLKDSRLNVDDILKRFRLLHIVLFRTSDPDSRKLSMEPIPGSVWSRRRFREGATLHISGTRTPGGQTGELLSALRRTVKRALGCDLREAELPPPGEPPGPDFPPDRCEAELIEREFPSRRFSSSSVGSAPSRGRPRGGSASQLEGAPLSALGGSRRHVLAEEGGRGGEKVGMQFEPNGQITILVGSEMPVSKRLGDSGRYSRGAGGGRV